MSDNYAEIVAVLPNKIKISVDKIEEFVATSGEEKVTVGSYLQVADNDDVKLIAIIENYSIALDDNGNKKYIIEAMPLGLIEDGIFIRGGDNIAIPPKLATIVTQEDIKNIYESNLDESEKFVFSKLSQNKFISVPVNGDKFFNKHIAVVGSTGSGKSHTVSKILQNAVRAKTTGYGGLNNSHIVIFDIHSEYQTAFPDSQYLDINNLIIPYWLLSSEELEEFFIDSDGNDHNQRNVFKEAVTKSKKDKAAESIRDSVHYDTATYFDIEYVFDFINEKNNEVISTGEVYKSGDKKGQEKTSQGSLYGKLSNFVSRLENKLNDRRLDFLLGKSAKTITFEDSLKQFIGYKDDKSNVTIIDLSGVPFEVLNITVALISRLLFEFGFYSKKFDTNSESKTPLLLVYEEAHKYVPKSDLSRFKSSTLSIERIVKEGRKYGVTAMIVSQRPSEISETIFSQCSTFVAMRLTNPNDQNYVLKLLPDTLNSLVDKLPTLQQGEALLMGESIIMPSLVTIDKCELAPSSTDIKYLQVWKEEWKNIDFNTLTSRWNEN